MRRIFMNFEEKKKLKELEFNAHIKYGLIWITFEAPLISKLLREYLEKNDFIVFIDKSTGNTGGLWVSGPDPKGEYKALRESFKSYGVELPPLSELPKL